jgi:protein-disulfide isomerase
MKNSNDQHNLTSALAASDHRMGAEHAALVLLEYGDYECPACCKAEPAVRHLIEAFGNRMKFIYRHFPLVEIHPHAELAAEAAEAAAAQGKFWPMHHLLFSPGQHLKMATLTHFAEQIELDMVRFQADMNDQIYTQRVQEHRRSGEALGLRSTPTFFLNRVLVDVSFGIEQLESAVRAALDKH